MRLIPLVSFALIFACDSDKGVTAFNSKPEASITSHSDGDTVLEGYLTTFRGSASDANHSYEDLTATWFVGTEMLCEGVTPESDGSVECGGVLLPTDTEVTLEVKDSGNATGSASVNLTVEPTAAPESLIHTPEANGVYYSDQKITFVGVLTDAEDNADTLIGFWESDLDGSLSDVDVAPNSEGEIEGFGYLTEGEHAIQLHVEDTTGKTGSSSVIIDVGPPNSSPLCEILTPLTGSAGPSGDTVQFTAAVSDVDVPSDWLNVAWSSDKDGELGTSTPNTSGDVLFSFSDLSVDSHTITMTVTDEIGATCSDFIAYTVGTPPEITIDAPINSEIYSEGSALDFIATVSDAQDQPDEVSLDWVLNTVSISNQGATSSGTAQFSDSSLTYGAYTLVVTATDTDGLTDSDQVTFTINGVPSAPDVEITPDPSDTTDQLTATVVTPSTDPEGSNITYSYVWLKDNVIQTSQTAQSVASTDTGSEETWTVRVYPNDGITDGPYGEASITIQNTPPVATSVVLTPNNPTSQTSIMTCTANGTDVDGDSVSFSYEWLIDNQIQTEISNMLSGPFIVGSLIACRATPTDGKDDGTPMEDSATVENTLPTVSSVTLSPSSVYTNDTVTATAVLDDVDGQTVTADYAWHVIDFASGSDSMVQSGADNTLSGVTHFDRDDEVYVVVTPNDGVDNGSTETSASLTVMNTAPGAPVVSLSPDPAIAGQDDLVCVVDVPSSDDDGDAVVYTYDWTDPNGGSAQTTTEVSDLSDTFAASGTTEGFWTCEVEPFDGTTMGPSDEQSVLVENGCQDDYAVTFSGGNPGTCCCTGGNVGNSYILADVSPNLSGASTATIEFWLNLDTYTQYGTILWSEGSGSESFAITNTSDCGYGSNRYKTSSDWGGVGVFSQSTALLSTWQHYALVFDNGTISYFVDGILQGTTTASTSTTPTIPNNRLYFGGKIDASNGNNQHQVNGSYRGIRISSNSRYSTNFIPDEVLTIDNDTLHLYSLDEGTGISVYDSVDPTIMGTIFQGSNGNESWSLYSECP